MFKIKHSILKKVSLLLLVSFCVIFGVTSVVMAQMSNDNLRNELLHSIVYYQTTVEDISDDISVKNQYNEGIMQNFANLSDEQLKKEAEKYLISILKQKQQHNNLIHWDDYFVEQIAKKHFPDLYPTMMQQREKDASLIKNSTTDYPNSVTALSYTPGREIHEFCAYGYHWSGYTLWAFKCRMDWSWDSTKITAVYPSTYAEIYDPSWGYAGLVANDGRFLSSTEYYKYVKGDFYWPLQQVIATHAYPWHEISVFAGGTYSWDHF